MTEVFLKRQRPVTSSKPGLPGFMMISVIKILKSLKKATGFFSTPG